MLSLLVPSRLIDPDRDAGKLQIKRYSEISRNCHFMIYIRNKFKLIRVQAIAAHADV